MCIRQHSAPLSAITPAISGSARSALTSFTRLAPTASAAAATFAFDVSIEICAVVPADASASITGTTRCSSSCSETGSAPGRVDSPPMSRISAPSPASSRPCAIAASACRNAPPSENESGVTFTIPITRNELAVTLIRGITFSDERIGVAGKDQRTHPPAWRANSTRATEDAARRG